MWYQKAKQPFQVIRPKWSLSAIRYLAIILLAKCGKSSPSQMNSRPIYQEMLNAVWLLEHSISYKTQFSSGSLAFHHYFATFCIFFLSLLIGMVCQACSYWALDQHSSKERGGNWGRNWEGCSAVARGAGWAHRHHPWERQESLSWGRSAFWDLRNLLCPTPPMCTEIHGWLWARAVMSVLH